jgi:hypothetical protein
VAFHRSQSRVHQEDVATEVVATMTSMVDSTDLLNQGSRAKDLQDITAAREHRIETPEIRMGLRVVIGTIVWDLGGLMLTPVILVKSLATLPDVSLCLLNKCLLLCHHGRILAPHPSVNLWVRNRCPTILMAHETSRPASVNLWGHSKCLHSTTRQTAAIEAWVRHQLSRRIPKGLHI